MEPSRPGAPPSPWCPACLVTRRGRAGRRSRRAFRPRARAPWRPGGTRGASGRGCLPAPCGPCVLPWHSWHSQGRGGSKGPLLQESFVLAPRRKGTYRILSLYSTPSRVYAASCSVQRSCVTFSGYFYLDPDETEVAAGGSGVRVESRADPDPNRGRDVCLGPRPEPYETPMSHPRVVLRGFPGPGPKKVCPSVSPRPLPRTVRGGTRVLTEVKRFLDGGAGGFGGFVRREGEGDGIPGASETARVEIQVLTGYKSRVNMYTCTS